MTLRLGLASRICRHAAIIATLCLLGAHDARAATYYVAPNGAASLSTDRTAPGSLRYAVANAPSDSVVILENGVYDGAPKGYTVSNSSVTFRARNWHSAIVKNSTGAVLWNPSNSSTVNDVCQGIVFGPCTGIGWSGGGGKGWRFLDCAFTQTGGMGAGDNCLFQHDLFTDCQSNSFDFAGKNQTIQNCVVRRGNRVNADEDSVGNKEDFTKNFTVDGLVDYDNAGAGIWFDTSNEGWLVKNSTFFANHGGANWFGFGASNGSTATKIVGSGQDSEEPAIGTSLLAISGTAANLHHSTTIQSITGKWPGPYTALVSPALPVAPSKGDQFAAQHPKALAVGDGFITEANDNGVFTHNWVFSNTDAGYFDHSSGGKVYGGSGGLTVTDNFFAYNAQDFFVWSDQRDQGPATVEYNRFKFVPGKSGAFDSWGSTPGKYPHLADIKFDYNDYDPDNHKGGWAVWYVGSPPHSAGGLTRSATPSGQDYLNNPSTWDQDLHSNKKSVPFRGTAPKTYIWPTSSDTDWKDVFFPNSTFGLTDSLHQIDDTDGAVRNTIDAAITGHPLGRAVVIPVAAHTPFSGSTCEVYDLNGRWVTLTVKPADRSAFEAAVPPYVTCVSGNKTRTYKITVVLTSESPYNISAVYRIG